MIEFAIRSRSQIDLGDFPLNHDCILKVRFIGGCPIRFCYLTCSAMDSGALVLLISSLPNVKDVEISSVDDLPIHF